MFVFFVFSNEFVFLCLSVSGHTCMYSMYLYEASTLKGHIFLKRSLNLNHQPNPLYLTLSSTFVNTFKFTFKTQNNIRLQEGKKKDERGHVRRTPEWTYGKIWHFTILLESQSNLVTIPGCCHFYPSFPNATKKYISSSVGYLDITSEDYQGMDQACKK